MTTTIAGAIAAYANTAKAAGPELAGPVAGSGTSFGDLLKKASDATVGALHEGEAASLRAATGKADITEVVTAMSNAELTLQTVTAVRDRVISAYQDILRMPI